MAESWLVPVYSSMVSEVGYDADSGELLVKWKGGKTSAYSGVSEAMALELSQAPSVGQMINSHIKNQYPHRYV